MADQYLNKTVLAYFYNRLKTIFAAKTDIPANTSDLTNDGDGTGSPFATEAYADAHGGAIDVVQKNGTPLPITDKTVNVTVPTAVSELTNDEGYQTADDVQDAIDASIASAVEYKGTVATESALPMTGNKKGDMYDVTDTGENYVWNGSSWDKLGTMVDTSLLWAKAELTAITTAEIDAIIEA